MLTLKFGDIVVVKENYLEDDQKPDCQYVVLENYNNGTIKLFTKEEGQQVGVTSFTEERSLQLIGYVQDDNKPHYLNKEKLDDELSYLSMLESTIAYGWSEGITSVELISKSKYLDKYIKKIGYDRALVLADYMLSRVDHIEKAVYIDSDGLSYNSIIWKC